jgi:hypothetical protein
MCAKYLKMSSCEHARGFSVLKGYADLPAEVQTVPIGQKRKRGRPKKVGSALQLE